MVLEKKIDLYVKTPGNHTEIIIAENPDTIMEVIGDLINTKSEEEEITMTIDDKRYKATITYNKQPPSEEVKADPLIVTFRILRVEDATQEYFCLDFIRKSGDSIEFINFFKDLELHIYKKFGYVDEEDENQE